MKSIKVSSATGKASALGCLGDFLFFNFFLENRPVAILQLFLKISTLLFVGKCSQLEFMLGLGLPLRHLPQP